MYIKKIVEENVGPIEKAQLEFSFSKENPKPVIIVGENGTGKTTLISNIVDSFYEMAGTAYTDARKQAETEGYEFYKTITPLEIQVGKKYLYSYIQYEDEHGKPSSIDYVFKSGLLSIDDFKNKFDNISPQISWKDNDNFKIVTVDSSTVEKVLSENIICYFGPDRYEKPYWLGGKYYETMNYEHITVKNKFAGQMELPILVSGMTTMTLQWLLDVIVDSRGDIGQDEQGNLRLENVDVGDMLKLGVARKNIEKIMSNQKAYAYLTQTQEYENDIYKAIDSKKEKMLIITEGTTDWKHMKAAYNCLSQRPEYNEIFDGFEFEFLEYEPKNSKSDAVTKLEMGNKSLSALCENIAKLKQSRKVIFIADRDVEDTNKKLGGKEKEYKEWGNDVYSFIIPVPESRKATPNICIEHLYTDDIIKTEVKDEKTKVVRRLYMGNEFDNRGVSYDMKTMCERKDICGENSIAIIEGSTGERVTKLSDCTTNIALTKMAFANMILKKETPFENVDFSNFLEVFKILRRIYDVN